MVGLQAFCTSQETHVKSMNKTILTFGLISGLFSASMMSASLLLADRIGYGHSYLVGYTIIVLSFLLVYFGIRSFRDNVGDGQITFGKAFTIGISITLISSIFYVVSWEVLYFNFMPGFMENYSAHIVSKMQASGASATAIASQVAQLKKYKEMYDNPLTNAALTFLEPFPIGLLITLLSAALLRASGALPGGIVRRNSVPA